MAILQALRSDDPALRILRNGDRIVSAIEGKPGEIVAYRIGEVYQSKANGKARMATTRIKWGAEIPADILEAVALEAARKEATKT